METVSYHIEERAKGGSRWSEIGYEYSQPQQAFIRMNKLKNNPFCRLFEFRVIKSVRKEEVIHE